MKKIPTLSKQTLLVIFLCFYSVITAQDYVDSDGSNIWETNFGLDADNVFNYNVTYIGQDNASGLNQKQSKTINTDNDITIGIKNIATTNSLNTNAFFADNTF